MAKRVKVETWAVRTEDGSRLAGSRSSTQFSRRGSADAEASCLPRLIAPACARATRAAEKLDG